MKILELKQMETLRGGDLLDGACAVLGFTEAGIAVRYLVGESLVIPGWGLALLAVGTLACVGRGFKLW